MKKNLIFILIISILFQIKIVSQNKNITTSTIIVTSTTISQTTTTTTINKNYSDNNKQKTNLITFKDIYQKYKDINFLSINIIPLFSFLFYSYTPESNYIWYLNILHNSGIGVEYKLFTFLGFEGSQFINIGINVINTKYYDRSSECYYAFLKLYEIYYFAIDMYLQESIFVKYYIKEFQLKSDKFKSLYFDKFTPFIRFGLTFEAWLLSYYFLYSNDEKVGEGNLFDDTYDGPNALKKYLDFRNIYNPFNVGITTGVGVKIYKTLKFALSPEIKYSFFFIPVTDGTKNNSDIKGVNSLIIRNNGNNDSNIKDLKMELQVGVTISLGFLEPPPYQKIIIDNLNFVGDSPQLLPDSEEKLLAIGLKLKKYYSKKIEIVGHAAETGRKKWEQELSEMRAKTVRDYFIKIGVINPSTSTYIGKGSDEPIADNKTEEGRKQNRRVEIFIFSKTTNKIIAGEKNQIDINTALRLIEEKEKELKKKLEEKDKFVSESLKDLDTKDKLIQKLLKEIEEQKKTIELLKKEIESMKKNKK